MAEGPPQRQQTDAAFSCYAPVHYSDRATRYGYDRPRRLVFDDVDASMSLQNVFGLPWRTQDNTAGIDAT